jgi:hypothetical protein
MAKPRLVRVLTGVDMRQRHHGLALTIHKVAGIDVRLMDGGDMIACINASETILTVIGGGGAVLGTLKMPHGRKLMREAVQFIPKVFGGDGFTYDDACREALNKVEWNKRLRVPEKLAKTNASFVKVFGMVANKQTLGAKEAPRNA